ncbi:Hypothetical predicted protein, partial [Podarcis lilfordi]
CGSSMVQSSLSTWAPGELWCCAVIKSSRKRLLIMQKHLEEGDRYRSWMTPWQNT